MGVHKSLQMTARRRGWYSLMAGPSKQLEDLKLEGEGRKPNLDKILNPLFSVPLPLVSQ